jgi:dTDP-glucose pyrophosphorylase
VIVIPMAGASSRFTRAGYAVPKWQLELLGRPLLDWSLLTFAASFDSEPFLLLYRDTPGTLDFVRGRTAALGISEARFQPMPSETRGQADTVAIGLDAAAVDDDEPLTIFNIDTIRLGYRPDPLIGRCDGLVECFRGEGEHWSFVLPAEGSEQRAAAVAEKVRISDLCSSGLYWFRDASTFRQAFREEEAAPAAGELYVAPLYQRLIDAGRDVRYSVVERPDLVFSGTPDEYELAKTSELLARSPFAR